jgi:hypothetical protein
VLALQPLQDELPLVIEPLDLAIVSLSVGGVDQDHVTFADGGNIDMPPTTVAITLSALSGCFSDHFLDTQIQPPLGSPSGPAKNRPR